jgi:predicted nucleotidyltransferase
VLTTSGVRPMLKRVRIDPKGTIAGCPTLTVRGILRSLRGRSPWTLSDLERAAELPTGSGRRLVQVLRDRGLVEPGGRAGWGLTQAGVTFAGATAAKPITRATAERALAQFLDRVRRADQDPYFLARPIRVVLYGSMLRPEVERLSDVDLAVQLVPKETDPERAQRLNQERAEELAALGHRFRNVLEVVCCWHLETFQFLKCRSRVISLADYALEKSFILAVPHRFLAGTPEEIQTDEAATPAAAPRKRRPRGVPF